MNTQSLIGAIIGGAMAVSLSACASLPTPTSVPPPAVAGGGEARPYPLPPGSYRIFTGAGAEASLPEILSVASGAEVLLLGEMHDDRAGHALQYEIFRALVEGEEAQHSADGGTPSARRRGVVLSLEMFERDVQYVLDEYLDGLIREDHFQRSSRPWPHYDEDYRPLVELARSREVPVIAANAPRRYVNMVTRGGPSALDRLSTRARESLPPLPYQGPSAAYRGRLEAEMGGHGTGAATDAPSYGIYAQALWDAGMANSIAESLRRDPSSLVVHLAGSFHVSYGLGLPEHLQSYRPGTRIVTVVVRPTTPRDSIPTELLGAGDFVILTDPAHVR